MVTIKPIRISLRRTRGNFEIKIFSIPDWNEGHNQSGPVTVLYLAAGLISVAS